MAKQTVIPFGPQHPVLPEPVHLDLVLEDERVVQAIPRIGYIHRGLEKLVETRDIMQYVYVTERICGICSFGHSLGYSETVESLMGIEIPERAKYLRVIWHELSRMHSHILWLGLAADGFGYEALFMHCFRLRERILDIFERTTGGRVIFSACNVGGVKNDITDEDLRGIAIILDKLKKEYDEVCNAFLKDASIANRLVDVGYLSPADAKDLCVVGPFARASGIAEDVRLIGTGAYAYLSDFEPVIDDRCDGYARAVVRAKEVYQSIEIIKEMIDKIPEGEVSVKVKGSPEDGAEVVGRVEQPRGECVYYAKGNGTKYLERMRMRTPTATNIGGMAKILEGCDLADVPLNILTIDPCISCTER